MKLIERTFYLDKLKDVMGTPDIKVITGVRRSGKSKLLEAFMEYVRQTDKNANIMHVNYSLSEYEPLLEYHKLNEYVEQAYQEGKTNYIFIDEVQMCDGFEKAINNFHATEKYDIYITGSNAFLLSSDLATLFTGRTFEIEVYPFSFAEFMQYYDLSDQYAAFNRYLTEGGMAGSFLYKTPEAKYDYISDVFSTLIVRDIQKKYKIRNMPLMDRLCDFLIDNISNLTSTRSIAAAFTKEQFKTNEYFTLVTPDGVPHRVKSASDVAKLFPDQKIQIKQFAKQNSLSFEKYEREMNLAKLIENLQSQLPVLASYERMEQKSNVPSQDKDNIAYNGAPSQEKVTASFPRAWEGKGDSSIISGIPVLDTMPVASSSSPSSSSSSSSRAKYCR